VGKRERRKVKQKKNTQSNITEKKSSRGGGKAGKGGKGKKKGKEEGLTGKGQFQILFSTEHTTTLLRGIDVTWNGVGNDGKQKEKPGETTGIDEKGVLNCGA